MMCKEVTDAYIGGAWHIANNNLIDDYYGTLDDEPPYYEKGTQEYEDWKRGCFDEHNGDYDVYRLYKESLSKGK